jgi:hypothetical protein
VNDLRRRRKSVYEFVQRSTRSWWLNKALRKVDAVLLRSRERRRVKMKSKKPLFRRLIVAVVVAASLPPDGLREVDPNAKG